MTPEERLDAAAAKYRRTKTAHEAARDELREAVVVALQAEVKPSVVSRKSGWDREYNRRLLKQAEEPAPPAP